MSFQSEGPTDEYAQVHKPPKQQQTVTTHVRIYIHIISRIYSYIRTVQCTYVRTYVGSN